VPRTLGVAAAARAVAATQVGDAALYPERASHGRSGSMQQATEAGRRLWHVDCAVARSISLRYGGS
jgi:hypothetical protein